MQCFLGCSSLLLYVLSVINGLITQRSVVQIHPPQPTLSITYNHPIPSVGTNWDQNLSVSLPAFLEWGASDTALAFLDRKASVSLKTMQELPGCRKCSFSDTLY